MQNIMRIAIVGISGYTGYELVRLLRQHPRFQLNLATSRQEQGHYLQDIFPVFRDTPQGRITLSPPDADLIAENCDLAFLAVPNGAAMEMAADLLQRGLKVVDLSADFRLRNSSVYEEWYGIAHSQGDLQQRAVYGIPEIYSRSLAQADLVANPGCYPTSVILGLYPALAQGLIHTDSLVLDSKSGASGAGRKANTDLIFCEVGNNFRPYNLGGKHRHTPEIEQELSRIAGKEITVSFNPHLLPVDRGIISTMYARPAEIDPEEIHTAYTSFFKDQEWVRVLPLGSVPRLGHVQGSMCCDIGIVPDRRAGRTVIVSAIDNLNRGASGQALANANLVCGLAASTGLDSPKN